MEITIFTTPNCPYCIKTKEFFKEQKIHYKEIDVTKDQKAARELISRTGHTGVPQIEIKNKTQNTFIIGFNKQALKKALH